MRALAPYGTWTSPLTPERVAAAGIRYGVPRLEADGAPSWHELRPAEGGRIVPVRFGPDGSRRDLVPPGHDARTRVHEYGGGAATIDGEDLWFAEFADQRIYRARGGVVEPISRGEGFRFAEPQLDPARGRIVAVGEHHAPGRRYPQNGLVEVDLRDGAVRWLVSGHDFFAAPRLSPDGRRLAFLAWDHPSMPWDAATLYVASVRDDGSVEDPVCVAGDAEGSVNGLIFRDDDSIVFALEVDDRWQPHLWERGVVRRLASVPGELGAPQWYLGTQSFALASRDELVGVVQRDGLSAVVSVDLRPGGGARVLREDLPHVGALDARGDQLLLLLGFEGSGVAVLLHDRARGEDTVLAGALPEGRAPSTVRFPTSDGALAHAFLHEPEPHAFEAPTGDRPPVIVIAHGGPTAAASPLPSHAIRFWTTRGFSVLDVLYRGSTGFGRTYREALRGRWGELDVEDCVAGARWLCAQGRARSDGCFISGASAGGLTVLMALCEHDVFRGATCLFGISDPRTLGVETHKFESRYEVFLFGEGEALEAAMAARTPLAKVDRLRAPIAFFHGLEDLAVLPSQTRGMHEALAARGLRSEYHGYEGEQHGFRKAETIRDVYARSLAFYLRCLGYAP